MDLRSRELEYVPLSTYFCVRESGGEGRTQETGGHLNDVWYLGTEEWINSRTNISICHLFSSFFSVSNSSREQSPAFRLHLLTTLDMAPCRWPPTATCDRRIQWPRMSTSQPPAAAHTADQSFTWKQRLLRLLSYSTHAGISPTPSPLFSYPCPSPGSWWPKASGFYFGHRPLPAVPRTPELFCGSLSSWMWQFPTTSVSKIKPRFPIANSICPLIPSARYIQDGTHRFSYKTKLLLPACVSLVILVSHYRSRPSTLPTYNFPSPRNSSRHSSYPLLLLQSHAKIHNNFWYRFLLPGPSDSPKILHNGTR